jgi:signal peptidase I
MQQEADHQNCSARTAHFLIRCASILMLVFALGTNTMIIAQGAFEPIHVISGDSMAPAIHSNDGLILTRPEAGDLRLGQVVVFEDPEVPDQYVAHRIVGVEKREGSTYLITKGDNNPEPDPFLVPTRAVLGKVVLRLPAFGIFLDFVRTPFGFSTCVLCPIMLFFFWCFAEKALSSSGSSRGLRRIMAIPVIRG